MLIELSETALSIPLMQTPNCLRRSYKANSCLFRWHLVSSHSVFGSLTLHHSEHSKYRVASQISHFITNCVAAANRMLGQAQRKGRVPSRTSWVLKCYAKVVAERVETCQAKSIVRRVAVYVFLEDMRSCHIVVLYNLCRW